MSAKIKKDDIIVIEKIRELLADFYPEVAIAILEYSLMVANKDLEG